MAKSVSCWCAVHRRPPVIGISANARAASSKANGRVRATNMYGDPTAPTDTAHLEHVVGAPAVAVGTVGSPNIFVARARPFSFKDAARAFALIPITGGR